MLIAYSYVYVLIGLVAVMTLILAVMAEKNVEKKTMYTGLAWLVGVAGGLAAAGAFIVGGGTIIFEGKSGNITHSKLLLFGTKDIALDDGSHLTLTNGESGTLIVNNTDRPLVVKTAEYSSMSFGFGGKADQLIPPGQTYRSDHGVDNFGPDDPLPSSVSSKSSFETRVQVTW